MTREALWDVLMLEYTRLGRIPSAAAEMADESLALRDSRFKPDVEPISDPPEPTPEELGNIMDQIANLHSDDTAEDE